MALVLHNITRYKGSIWKIVYPKTYTKLYIRSIRTNISDGLEPSSWVVTILCYYMNLLPYPLLFLSTFLPFVTLTCYILS